MEDQFNKKTIGKSPDENVSIVIIETMYIGLEKYGTIITRVKCDQRHYSTYIERLNALLHSEFKSVHYICIAHN